jgi:hypothetical protein
LYATYDSPPRSVVFDLVQDPNAQNNILTSDLKKHYDDRIIEYLQNLSTLYGYQPAGPRP